MASVNFTIYDPETGEIKCHGVGPAHLVERYQAAKPGCRALLGRRGSILEDKVIVPSSGSAPYLRRRAKSEIEARRAAARPSVVEPLAVLVEALKARGIDLTTAELSAARGRLAGEPPGRASG